MRFDDLDYCVSLISEGKYPKIHDDIFLMTKYVKASTVIDLGCCHGLLSHRLGTVYNKVIGVESSDKYLRNAIKRSNVEYKMMKIEMSTLDEMRRIIIQNGVQAVFARRVIPEIWETGGDALCEKFAQTLYDSGVQYIVLEGRKATKNPRNKLHNADKECAVFLGKYRTTEQYKDCRVLERI